MSNYQQFLAGQVTFNKSIFGITIETAKYNKAIDLPMNPLHKLIRYMLYKDRTPDVFAALVASAKVLVNDDKELKELG